EDMQRRAHIAGLERPGVECPPLHKMPGEELLLVAIGGVDEPLVRPFLVTTELAIGDFPPLTGSILPNVLKFPARQNETQNLLGSPDNGRFIGLRHVVY